MASSYQLTGLESEEEEEEDSAATALMRSTGKEIEVNCKLIRYVIESQKEKEKKQSLV